ncbi:MAG: nitroreductase family protein [Candidatus Acidiferrales bacterium]
MEKVAETAYPIHNLLKHRWSPRAFSDRRVEPATLRSLFEAARWAASCANEQPWNFIVATKDEPQEFERMLNCLTEGNIGWAKNAPVLIISVARLDFEKSGGVNRTCYYDVGQSLAQMALEAVAEGLQIHQMAGIVVDKVREVYGIPEGWDPVTGIAVGYVGDPNMLPEKRREMELGHSARKPSRSFVFSGRWAEPSKLFTE